MSFRSFFVYYSRSAHCKYRGLHFYVEDTQDRNVNLPIDSKCKKFAFKSRWTLPQFNLKLNNFPWNICSEFHIICFVYCGPHCFDSNKKWILSGKHMAMSFISFFVFCSWFVFFKDRRLHFHMHDTRDLNVDLPLYIKCKNFALKTHCTLLDST